MVGAGRVLRAGSALVAAVVVAVLGGAAPAQAAAPTASDRAGAVQALLERVVGTGGAVVQIAEQVNGSSGVRTVVRYGAPVTASSQVGVLQQAGGAMTTTVQQDAVDRSVTTVRTPPGALVRQTVTVLVDRSRLAGTSLGTLRRLVATAAGVQAARGDRVLVVATRFAAAPATTARATPTDWTALAVPAMWIVGGVAALVILLTVVRRRSRA